MKKMISKRVLKTAEGWLGKRSDLLEEERSALLNYIRPMKNVEALATTRWFVNEIVRLPEDQPKVSEAIKVAKLAKVDPLTYPSPMSILNTFKQYKIKEKAIDPDTVPELSNGQTIGPPSFSIRVYDVEDTKEGQLAMRKIINTHWGEDANPWCLLQGDGTGKLSPDAWKYWNHYDGVPKRVAFKDGKLLAFCANDYAYSQWWDRKDSPHDGISFHMKIPNDELGREATYEMSNDGKLGNPTNIHKGNKQNGVYEKWTDDGQIVVRENYKGGKRDGICERWWTHGKLRYRESYKNEVLDGPYEYRDLEGNLVERGNFKNGKYHGLIEQWDVWNNGVLESRKQYKEDILDGISELYYSDGSLESRQMYRGGARNGLCQSWHENGQMKSRCNYKEELLEGPNEKWYENGLPSYEGCYKNGKRDGEHKEWYENGQLLSRSNWVSGEREGLQEAWNENGRLRSRALYKGGYPVENLTDDVRFRKYLEREGISTEYIGSKWKWIKKITLKPKKKGGIKI